MSAPVFHPGDNVRLRGELTRRGVVHRRFAEPDPTRGWRYLLAVRERQASRYLTFVAAWDENDLEAA